MVFGGFCPWKEHLDDLEAELQLSDAAKPIYVVYPDDSGSWYYSFESN